MERKVITRHFRCSEKESEEITNRAKQERKTESAYLRDAALNRAIPHLPGEVLDLLKEIQFNELKIGNNINQAVRLCNSKKLVSERDYRKLLEMLVELSNQRDRILSTLAQMAKG